VREATRAPAPKTFQNACGTTYEVLRFDMVEGTARIPAIPSAAEQFDDSIRDRGVEVLREAVTKVGRILLRDRSTVDMWNRRLPRRRSR
jgi:hypothetical protein